MTDLTELRRLAEEAIGHDWSLDEADVAFQDKCRPRVIVQIIDELTATRALIVKQHALIVLLEKAQGII